MKKSVLRSKVEERSFFYIVILDFPSAFSLYITTAELRVTTSREHAEHTELIKARYE